MAKLKYTAPLFNICPIPLEAAAGTGNGCARELTQAEYVCAVEDPFTGAVLFMSSSICSRIPASESEANDTACYHVPMTDFNIYNS